MATPRPLALLATSGSSRKWLCTSCATLGIKDKFLFPGDAHKRPSDVEIKKKGLPHNTPTVIQRVARDSGINPYWTSDRHSGYHKGLTGTWSDYVDPDASVKEIVTEAAKALKVEAKKLVKEIPTTLPLLDCPKEGEERIAFEFDTADKRNDWIITCDSTWGEGYSTASLAESGTGKAVFSGELVTRPPNDGRTKNAGYVNMRSVYQHKSFGRVKDLDWLFFTHLVIRARGDGRTYLVNLHYYDEYNIFWNDLHQFPLFTRGGPYWQTTVIPFSKFVLSAGGRIQDDIEPARPQDVVALGITLADNIDGPFNLEIDSVKVRYKPDRIVNEDYGQTYETYKFPRNRYNLP